VFFISQYLQLLQTYKLIIEKKMVAKQQHQLNEFLSALKKAVILYKVKPSQKLFEID
jgi:hypothetical protein